MSTANIGTSPWPGIALRIASAAALLLLVPLLAMQFTPEVDWGVGDFVAAFALLFATGITLVFVARRVRTPLWRRLAVAAVVLVATLLWAELAVGILR